ncbi:MAG: hypothetical protein LBE18_12980 [Planctomycetaceae bacterium]|jgi:hypothetical protein|nr:hypothetical protein [Planctomycetaceae bacterium]
MTNFNNFVFVFTICFVLNVLNVFADSLSLSQLSVSAESTNPTVSAVSLSDSGIYLTKSEFDEFLRDYRLSHSLSSGVSGSSIFRSRKIKITPYGYINLSASYETQRTVTGDYAVYANSPDIENDSGYNVDPKSTRLGLKLEGVGISGWKGSKSEGAVEFDFQGAYQSRNRGGLLLRKAYFSVSDGKTKILAGQDWEIISPLYPKTLNYTAGACVGNVGYRRAMLRVDRQFDLCNSADNFLLQFGITDNVFRDDNAVSPAASSYPIIQGRLAYSIARGRNHGSNKPIILGVSSHFGEQRFTFGGIKKSLPTWSFNVDFDLPLTKCLWFQMEYFIGENLATIEGGILQGVDIARQETIRSQGGWMALTYQATKKTQMNFCYMVDDPFNKDVISGNSNSNRARNYSHCLFINLLYNWSDSLMTGFEIDFWRTHWQQYDPVTKKINSLSPGKPIRYDFTIRYTF